MIGTGFRGSVKLIPVKLVQTAGIGVELVASLKGVKSYMPFPSLKVHGYDEVNKS